VTSGDKIPFYGDSLTGGGLIKITGFFRQLITLA